MSSGGDRPFLNIPGCWFQENPDNSSNFAMLRKQFSGDLTGEDKKKKHEVDSLLSEAMNKLAFEERQKQQEALHGVGENLCEEANAVEKALVELDRTLSRIKFGSLYETAEQMDPSHVQSRDFRIMFLRAKRYDTQAAAKQMLKFFEAKKNLFGLEKLTKDITIEDLDEDDLACLGTGWLQFCGKDRSGRAVVVQLLGLRAYRTIRNELRVKFFMLMDILKDEEVQLRGVVALKYAVGNLRDSQNRAGYIQHMELANRLPLYAAAMHVCCNDVSQYVILKLAIATLPQKLRSRFKVHIGSALECQYQLSTYGISRDNLPLLPGTNKVDMTRHMDWCRSHSAVTSTSSANYFSADAPTPKDVLYIGGNRSKNGGNNLLRNLVTERSNMYDSATSNEIKKRIVNGVIDTIHRTGGRFLIQSDSIDSAWVEVPREVLHLKITQAFRNHRRKVTGRRRKRS